MSVINTNVQSLIAQNALAQNNSQLNTSLERLSTGLQINSGADNPAGLIAVQNFNQQNTGLQTAISNAGLAGNVVGTAEGGLSEVSNLLTQLQGLVGQAANTGGLSSDQISADQIQVDSILNTINRIAGDTTFEGTHLLNGNLDYVTSGAKASALQNLQINSAVFQDNTTVAVNIKVAGSATQAVLKDTTSKGAVGSTVTLQITGSLGAVQLTFLSGASASAIAAAVNAVTSQTGVTASATISTNKLSSTALAFISQGYGSNQFVSVKTVSGGAFAISGQAASGTDATVTVNGALASANGLNVTYESSTLDLQFNLASQLNTTTTNESFTITGGGANFAFGPQVNQSGQASLGIGDVSSSSLGDYTDGFLESLGTGGTNSLTGNLDTAQNIVTAAINQVADLRGRLGAFQDYTVGSTVSSLNVAYENSSAAESSIEDTNFAAETSNLTRAQILTQSATTVLAQANATPQEALTLLRNV
jgi:flagellin